MDPYPCPEPRRSRNVGTLVIFRSPVPTTTLLSETPPLGSQVSKDTGTDVRGPEVTQTETKTPRTSLRLKPF